MDLLYPLQMSGIEKGTKAEEDKVSIRSIDQIDATILDLLRQNARMKNVEIARRVHLTEGGVRVRINKMIKDGIIEKFTICTRGAEISGIVLIKTHLDQTRMIIRRLKEISVNVYETTGEFDVAAEVVAERLEQFNRKVDDIRSFPGVTDTRTLIKLN